MPPACWITKATNIGSEYVILIAFPRQKWLRECSSMLLYTYIDCSVTSLFAQNIKAMHVALVVFLPFLNHILCLT